MVIKDDIMSNSEQELSENEEGNSSENDDDSDQFETEALQGKRKGQTKNTTNKKKKQDDQLEDDTGLNALKNIKEKIKPPTVEELNRLRETETLFNCNLFRLQIDELLNEIKMKQKYRTKLNSWFIKFEAFLTNLPETSVVNLKSIGVVKGSTPLKLKKLPQEIKDIHAKLPTTVLTDTDAEMSFPNTKTVKVSCLYHADALFGKSLCVDVIFSMPKAIFRAKDYLNNRYFVKRNVYLTNLAVHLEKSALVSSVAFDFQNGNELLPILSITTSAFANDKLVVRLIPAVEEDTFKLSRTNPDISNLRLKFLSGDNSEDVDDDQENVVSTSFYNSVLAHDLTLQLNNEHVLENLKEAPNMVDGIKLLCVWLMQRSLSEGHGAFTNELMSFLVVHLKGKGSLNKNMSSYQVARFTWSYLCKSDWSQTGIALTGNTTAMDTFQKAHDVVFLDKSGACNLANDLSAEVYQKVRTEAAKAVTLLDSGGLNSFQSLFITRIPFALQYDVIVNIFDVENDFKRLCESLDANVKANYGNFDRPLLIKHITSMFKKGLKSRANNIVPLLEKDTKFALGTQKRFDRITFGITLNADNAFNVIDLGPNDNTSEAEEFREFWGEMADLRRFKDGTICWAVFFKTSTIQGKRQIFRDVLNYVCEKKLNLSKYNIVCDQFETVLKRKHVLPSYPNGTCEEISLKAINSFDELSKILRALALPLDVTSVQGMSDVFCYSNAFPPIATNDSYVRSKFSATNANDLLFKNGVVIESLPIYTPALEAVIQLALHSKWPNDLDAIRHIKTAFFLKMSELLQKEHRITSSTKSGHLDVYYSGLVFRLYLYHPKEVAMLKKDVTTEGVSYYKDTEESLQLEKQLNVLPKVIGALNGIQARFPSFGPCTCLIKRWLRGQLIDDYLFPDVVISLLNASLYLNANVYENPNLPQIGFFRFLKLLSETDFSTQFVLTNFNDEIDKGRLNELETKFEHNRINYPALHIVTPYDEEKSLFTKNVVAKEILNRIKLLAIESLAMIDIHVNEKDFFDTKALFIPSLIGYHVLIHLKPHANPRRLENVRLDDTKDTQTLHEYFKEGDEKIPIVGFNPVQIYLKELRKNFGDVALFLHDTYGGNFIAVLFKPSATECRDFKVSHIVARKLDDDKKLVLNVDAIVECFTILGKGVVKNVQRYI